MGLLKMKEEIIKLFKDKFLKDLPIYINGFAVGTLFFRIPNVGIYECAMFVLSSLTFFWYGRNCKIYDNTYD